MPRRYRPICVDRTASRREHSQNFVNPGNAFNQGFRFFESWGNYASGEISVVAASRWTFSGVTNDNIINGLYQINIPRPQATQNSWNAHTADLLANYAHTYNITFSYGIDPNAGDVQNIHDFRAFAEDDGTLAVGFGCIIQPDVIDGTTIIMTIQSAGANVAVVTPAISPYGIHNYRLQVQSGKFMNLYMDGVLMASGQSLGVVPTGSKKLTIERSEKTTVTGGGGMIGPITLQVN